MKYYIIAGEASGDLHGSYLIMRLYQQDAQANIRCWGGDLMQAQGATLVKHYKDLAFMGFIEVVKNLPVILKNLAFCKNDITTFAPDVIIFIDYPGFNIKIAEWAKPLGYRTVYYISPQVWAWKEKRVHTIKKTIDKMLVILPFEKAYYQKFDYTVNYVGHPLIEVVETFKTSGRKETLSNKPIIALLPGSRRQEVSVKLPIMLKVSNAFPQFQFIVASAPGLHNDFYTPILAPYKNVSMVSNQTYNLLQQATAALVTSGTATLETALFGVPQVVCYKGNPISYSIAKRVINIKYISLVNLIMDKPVVTELIQNELTAQNCITQLNLLLNNQMHKSQLQHHYQQLYQLLLQGGYASANAAESIYQFLQQPQ